MSWVEELTLPVTVMFDILASVERDELFDVMATPITHYVNCRGMAGNKWANSLRSEDVHIALYVTENTSTLRTIHSRLKMI